MVIFPLKITLNFGFQAKEISFFAKIFWLLPLPKIRLSYVYEDKTVRLFLFNRELKAIKPFDKTEDSEEEEFEEVEEKEEVSEEETSEPKQSFFTPKRIFKLVRKVFSLNYIRATGFLGLGEPARSGLVSGYLFSLNAFKKLNFQVVPKINFWGYEGDFEVKFSFFFRRGLKFLYEEYSKNRK
ncbi:MAG: hypothetical protein DWQ06_04805 [Calditrichaeota bacterium]|nr:MAG: hypothetical protein DWQ06_04805 [Calditrichota bacterium]